MKLLVFSDSHGDTRLMERAVREEKPHHILHLGDVVRDAVALAEAFPQVPLDYVPGNCDGVCDIAQAERLITLEGVRLLMMHGHTRGVKVGIGQAALRAREVEAQVLLFGHTHQPLCDRAGDLWLLNPGSIHQGYLTTYGVVDIADGAASCRTVRVTPD